MCSEGKSVLQAHYEMMSWDPYWPTYDPYVAGDTHLWGEPI